MQNAARWTAVALFLATAVLYVGSPLVVPYGAAAVLWIGWVALAIGLVRTWRTGPWWLPVAAPAVAVVFWVAFVLAGEQLFGWTA